MRFDIRLATEADIPALVALMTDFYAESDFVLPATAATRAFSALFASPALGVVWLAEDAVFRSVTSCSPSVSAWSMAGFAALSMTYTFDRRPAGGVPVRRYSSRPGTARARAGSACSK